MIRRRPSGGQAERGICCVLVSRVDAGEAGLFVVPGGGRPRMRGLCLLDAERSLAVKGRLSRPSVASRVTAPLTSRARGRATDAFRARAGTFPPHTRCRKDGSTGSAVSHRHLRRAHCLPPSSIERARVQWLRPIRAREAEAFPSGRWRCRSSPPSMPDRETSNRARTSCETRQAARRIGLARKAARCVS